MRKIFRTPHPTRSPEEAEGYGWRIKKEENRNPTTPSDAATLPMLTWKATSGELNPTTIIPKIVPEGPEASFIALSFNDVDATTMASHTLRTTRSIDTVLAGLHEYATRHPVAA